MSSVRRPHGRLFQIRGPAVPKLLSPKLLCVHVRGTAHNVIRGRPKGSSVAFGDERDIISQIRRHLTAQCLAHQTGEFEPHGRWYHRADRQTYTDDINMKQNRSTDCETSQHIMTCEFITSVSDSHVLGRRSVEDEQTEHIDIPHTIDTCTHRIHRDWCLYQLQSVVYC